MRLIPPPLAIRDDEGFAHDIFGAKEAGERLATLVGGLDGHSVIVLDGDWGTGKTTFVKQWAGLMRARGHPVVYLDAFRSDHHADPFLAMLAEVCAHLEKVGGKDPSKNLATKVLDAAKPIIKAVSVAALSRTVANVSAGLIPGNAIVAATDAASGNHAEQDWLMTHLQEIHNKTASVEQFRTALGRAVATPTGDPSENASKRPLVFIIDELDRCKPSFALNVLERMKHVFAVDGICFVLVTHLKELAAMVKHSYGLCDPQRYLDKFYHLRVDIDSLLSLGKVDRVNQYLRYLADSMGSPMLGDRIALVTLKELAVIHDLNLRSLERVALGLALYDLTVSHHVRRSGHQLPQAAPSHRRPMTVLRYHPAGLVVSLCVLRICDAGAYRKAAAGQLTFAEAQDFLKLDDWNNRSSITKALTTAWQYVTGEPFDDELYHIPGISSASILPDICRYIDLFWQDDD